MLRFSPQTPQRLTCHRGEAGKKEKKGCQKKKKIRELTSGPVRFYIKPTYRRLFSF